MDGSKIVPVEPPGRLKPTALQNRIQDTDGSCTFELELLSGFIIIHQKRTVNDFPEDRVINLDDQDNTNFAVVNKETTLLTYEDNTAGENQLLGEDDTSLVYTFGNAGAEIRNLQPGDILTYEYAPGELLIARVQDITVNGDIVTIQGDDTLEPTDVFDILKIEEFADSGELVAATTKR